MHDDYPIHFGIGDAKGHEALPSHLARARLRCRLIRGATRRRTFLKVEKQCMPRGSTIQMERVVDRALCGKIEEINAPLPGTFADTKRALTDRLGLSLGNAPAEHRGIGLEVQVM